MPTFTHPMPEVNNFADRTAEEQVSDLKQYLVGLIDSLCYMFNNLDSGNVMSAASVNAEDINTNFAKIANAQIKDLTADKLTAGTIDVREIQVININADEINTGTLYVTDNMRLVSADGQLIMDGKTFAFVEDIPGVGVVTRLIMGKAPNGEFMFELRDKTGRSMLRLNEKGEGIFGGGLETDADCRIGHTLVMNGNDFAAGIKWVQGSNTVAEVYIDPYTKALHIQADGGVRIDNLMTKE